jgi:glycosyltransferase involved in cell wall biosynthesis
VDTKGELVSVVITCYNHGRFLADAIESVLRQRHGPKEIVVVDDGSSDDTAAVAARFPVKYVFQRNAGLSAARNTGCLESHGPFLVFLDADDRLLPDALSAGVSQLEMRPEAGMTYGRYVHMDGDGHTIGRPVENPIDEDPYLSLLRYNVIGMHATVMYRRSALVSVGMFDSGLRAAEDYELYLRCARRFPIIPHMAVVAEYRKHDTNMSNDSALMMRSIIRVLRREQPHVGNRGAYRAVLAEALRGNREHYLRSLRLQLRKPRPGNISRRRRLRAWVTLLRNDPRSFLKAGAPEVYRRWFRCSDAARNAALRLGLGRGHHGTIAAGPNPVCPRNGEWEGPVATTITWQTATMEHVEVRVGLADGPVFSASIGSGSERTGEWVRDRTRFFLIRRAAQDQTVPLRKTLAVVTVTVIPE